MLKQFKLMWEYLTWNLKADVVKLVSLLKLVLSSKVNGMDFVTEISLCAVDKRMLILAIQVESQIGKSFTCRVSVLQLGCQKHSHNLWFTTCLKYKYKRTHWTAFNTDEGVTSVKPQSTHRNKEQFLRWIGVSNNIKFVSAWVLQAVTPDDLQVSHFWLSQTL